MGRQLEIVPHDLSRTRRQRGPGELLQLRFFLVRRLLPFQGHSCHFICSLFYCATKVATFLLAALFSCRSAFCKRALSQGRLNHPDRLPAGSQVAAAPQPSSKGSYYSLGGSIDRHERIGVNFLNNDRLVPTKMW